MLSVRDQFVRDTVSCASGNSKNNLQSVIVFTECLGAWGHTVVPFDKDSCIKEKMAPPSKPSCLQTTCAESGVNLLPQSLLHAVLHRPAIKISGLPYAKPTPLRPPTRRAIPSIPEVAGNMELRSRTCVSIHVSTPIPLAKTSQDYAGRTKIAPAIVQHVQDGEDRTGSAKQPVESAISIASKKPNALSPHMVFILH